MIVAARLTLRRTCKQSSHTIVRQSFLGVRDPPYSSSSSSLRRFTTGKPRNGTLGEVISQRQSLPRFVIPSSQVELLEHPSHFYQKLLSIIDKAQKRIFIASLYIGKTETGLVSRRECVGLHCKSHLIGLCFARRSIVLEKLWLANRICK